MKKVLMVGIFAAIVFLSPLLAIADYSATPSAMTGEKKTVDYNLPYPGILPDNPLYIIKVIRDRIVGFLISDPVKKSAFDLLQADKRLQAGKALIEKKDNKTDLGITTISKGENYFEEAITNIQQAKKQGLAITETAQKLFLAAQKHEEILNNLEGMVNSNDKKKLDSFEKRVKDFEKQVDPLLPKEQNKTS